MTDKNLQLIDGVINTVQTDFTKLAKVHKAVTFDSEASYAIQLMKSNNFLAKTALTNQDSLKYAVLNVASIGLSLNPAQKYAYLVPRNGAVCLDISYMGLVSLAVESGAIKWVQAMIVRDGDDFSYNGPGLAPTHKFNAFKDRGKFLGVYCVAKTEDGEYLCDMMGEDAINTIRDRSEGYKAFKSGKIKTTPWESHYFEMAKKTVIKRAFKLWPKNDKASRLLKAVEIDNKNNRIDFVAEMQVDPASEAQINTMKMLLADLNRSEDAFMNHMNNVLGKNLAALADLNVKEAEKAIIQLNQFNQKTAGVSNA